MNSCVFNSQLAFYEDGDFLIHLAGLKGRVQVLDAWRYYKNTLKSLEKYGQFIGRSGCTTAEFSRAFLREHLRRPGVCMYIAGIIVH